MKRQLMRRCLPVVLVLLLPACAHLEPRVMEQQHRFFLEPAPGAVMGTLYAENHGGREVPLVEVDADGTVLGDTLTAWVQHTDDRRRLHPDADQTDLIITCHRELLPLDAQFRHVLPSSNGEIYVYAVGQGLITVAADRVPFYEVIAGLNDRGYR